MEPPDNVATCLVTKPYPRGQVIDFFKKLQQFRVPEEGTPTYKTKKGGNRTKKDGGLPKPPRAKKEGLMPKEKPIVTTEAKFPIPENTFPNCLTAQPEQRHFMEDCGPWANHGLTHDLHSVTAPPPVTVTAPAPIWTDPGASTSYLVDAQRWAVPMPVPRYM